MPKSLEIKKPKLVAGLLREMSGGEPVLFSTNACDKEAWRPHVCGRKWPLRFLLMLKKEWMRKRSDILLDFEGERAHQICSFTWADNFWVVSHSTETLEQMSRDLVEEASRWDLVPKATSLWWTSTYDSEEKIDMILGAASGCYKFPLSEGKFKMLGCAMNRQGLSHDAI